MLITIISLSVPKAITKHIIHHFHRALICAVVGMVCLIRRWWVLFTNRMIVILLKYHNKHNVYRYTLLNSNRLNVIKFGSGL